ncbi:MAG: IS1380 family transposase [Acidimicrobiia bacterium]
MTIEFSEEALSAHAGLELFGGFLRAEGWLDRIREVFADRCFDSDYGSFRMTLVAVGLLLLGGERLAHLEQLRLDPVFHRFASLSRLPSERTFSRWLKDISEGYRDRLRVLLRDVAFSTWARGALHRVTIDVDGTVIRTGESVDGAERGFNPHHPKDPSYYPLTAQLAQTGQLLDVVNRSGRVNDSVGSVEMLGELIEDARSRAPGAPIEVRLDGAFCQKAVLDVLETSGVEYAMKMPMWEWLGILDRVRRRKTWTRIDKRRSAFSTDLRIEKWKRTVRVIVYRKQISGKPAKAFQLSLFQPDDGYFEYSMVVTNKAESERAVWHFMAGRGGHEKTLGELKQNVAFATVPTNDWDANSTWQLLSALTHNLARDFQVKTGLAASRKNGRKRTARFVFRSLRTLRFTLLAIPGRICHPGGRQELRIVATGPIRNKIRHIEQRIAA